MSEFFKPSDFDFREPRNADWVTTVKEQAAHIANMLLAERGTVVYGRYLKREDESFEVVDSLWSKYRDDEPYIEDNDCRDTHRALLINITPIGKDTAEGLLRKFSELVLGNDKTMDSYRLLCERAKKLLGK